MYLYPGDQPYSPASSSSWALSTVLTCGLQLPLTDVNAVQVKSPSHGFDNSLSTAQLSDPSQFHDPAAPDALPVISVDGTEDQNTYVRPWFGGSDDNAGDQVITNASPIAIVVYENGPPLRVTGSWATLSRNATRMTVQLRASVSRPDGAPIPASTLSWSWSFGDGGASSAAAPRHSFAPGVYPVTVQVADNRDGTGGTDTIHVTFSTSSGSGQAPQPGAGPTTHARSPTGPERSSAAQPRAASRTARAGRETTQAAQTQRAPAHVQPAAHRVAPSATVHRASPHEPARAAATPPAAERAVAGQLISAISPLPIGASPLVHIVPAAVATPPQVRGAVGSSITTGALAGLAALLLFGLGAWRELRR
jgi:hypothetical protein